MFCVESGTRILNATTATSTGTSQETVDQDADLDLAPLTGINADTLALDLQEIDVIIEIETIEDDHLKVEEIVAIVMTAEMIVTTERVDAMTVIDTNAVATVQTVKTSGEEKIEVEVQKETGEEETVRGVEVQTREKIGRGHLPEKTVNTQLTYTLIYLCCSYNHLF